jgi:hypothetical protein
MTETEWLTAADPHAMLIFLQPPAGSWLMRLLVGLHFTRPEPRVHKFEHFACACCRRLWELLPDARSRTAIEVFENYAAGFASHKELRLAASAAAAAAQEADAPRPATASRLAAAQARAAEAVAGAFDAHEGAHLAANWAREAIRAWAHGPGFQKGAYVEKKWQRKKRAKKARPPRQVAQVHEGETEWQAERQAQCDMLRDIVGNPFHSVTIDRAALRPKVVDLARTIARSRAFQDLPRLADALEEAGCTEAPLLQHCRAPGLHVHGCWALALLLGN